MEERDQGGQGPTADDFSRAAAEAAASATAPVKGATAGTSAGSEPHESQDEATPDNETTVPTPLVTPSNAGDGPGDETAVLPSVQATESDAETTAKLPRPPVPQGAADETAVLPPVRDGEAGDLAHRVPKDLFRDERQAPRPGGAEDRTRELPQLDSEGRPSRRPRPDWAEETPLDDLPTLADELLGRRDDDRNDGPGRGRRR